MGKRSGLAFLALTPVTAGQRAGTAAKPQPIPSLADVQQTVSRYFQGRRDFQPGDLLTRDDVIPLLVELQEKGLLLADADEIWDACPPRTFSSREIQHAGRPEVHGPHCLLPQRLRSAGSAC